jgi:hypothetical protein
VFDLVLAHGAWVPGIWRLDVGNVLETGLRRRRHTDIFRDEVLIDLARLPIRLDRDTDRHAWAATVHLASRLATWNLRKGCARRWRHSI